MQFESFEAFIAMGGYGIYVWSAFFVTFLALGIVAAEAILKKKKLAQEVTRQKARNERIRKAKKEVTS